MIPSFFSSRFASRALLTTLNFRFSLSLPPFSKKKNMKKKVSAKDYPRFIESYGTILKAHMDGLRKRERVRGAAAGKGGAGGGKK